MLSKLVDVLPYFIARVFTPWPEKFRLHSLLHSRLHVHAMAIGQHCYETQFTENWPNFGWNKKDLIAGSLIIATL